MQARALYGVLLGVVLTVASRSGTTAWRLVMLAFGIQLLIGATLIWERTRLPRWTAAMALVAGACFIFAMLPGGSDDVVALCLAYPLPAIGVVLTPAALTFSESYFSKQKWQQVKNRSETVTLSDMLLRRHIPDLR